MDHPFNPGRIRIPAGSDLGTAKEESLLLLQSAELGSGWFSRLTGLFLISGLKSLGNLGTAPCLTRPVPR